jgi:hypothetical protein
MKRFVQVAKTADRAKDDGLVDEALRRIRRHSVLADKDAVTFYESCGFEQSVCMAIVACQS